MGYGISLWLVPFWVLPVFGELPLPAPEVRQPRVISRGAEGPVPRLPWRWMTWNLQWFPGQHPQASSILQQRHIQSVGQAVEKMRPQVILLQEVLDGEALCTASPSHPWRVMSDFQRAGDENERLPAQNVALISQWPWKEVWEIDFHNLPLTADRPVRGFLAAKFQDDLNQTITVYGIHLKSNRGGRGSSEKRRGKAIAYLRWDWRRRGLDPGKDFILVGGDFNCSVRNPELTEETFRSLRREGWQVADESLGWPEGATVRADAQGRFPAVDFDHFFLSPSLARELGQKTQDVKIYSRGNIPSDHFPVELTIHVGR
ncbi:MAG: hypothetical protein EB090_04580 [Verrucomicrobia bacterium]|nr:hypothetical protein [Verrucomicrobiota bacterium]